MIENKRQLDTFKKNSKFYKQYVSSQNKTQYTSTKILKKISFLTIKFYHMRKSLSENFLEGVFKHYKVIFRAITFKKLKINCLKNKRLREMRSRANYTTKYGVFSGWKIRTKLREGNRYRNQISRIFFMEKLINRWMIAFNKSKAIEQRARSS